MAAVSGFLSMLFAGPVIAKPKVSVFTRYYDVEGQTTEDLRADMERNGPQGFWAHTSWHVRWNRHCELTVRIVYTMPRIVNRDDVPEEVLEKWDEMYQKLATHEGNHANHGVNAAIEIQAAGCENADDIIRKWSDQDGIYDKATDHGRLEGLSL